MSCTGIVRYGLKKHLGKGERERERESLVVVVVDVDCSRECSVIVT